MPFHICTYNLANIVQLQLWVSHLLLNFLHTQLNVPCKQVVYKSYNMGTHGLPDIYTLALGPVALGHRVYILGKLLLPML